MISIILSVLNCTSERRMLVSRLRVGRLLGVSRGRHCSAKYLLKMAAFSLKQEIYLLISISGGMLAIFFLFKSLLKAVQKHLGPVVGSHILFPRSKRYLSFAFVIILVVSFWVRVTRDLSSGFLPRADHFLKTRLFFLMADLTSGVIQGASLPLKVLDLFGMEEFIVARKLS